MKKTAEKGKKIVLGVLLVLACILMPQKMTNAAGNTVPTAVDNLTVSLRNKVNMAVTDNGYMRVVYDGSKVRVEYYDTQFNLQRKGSLDLELPIWGGFYAGQDAYYLAEAQSNTEQSDTKEVIRVIKYDKNWKRLGAASITGDPELFGGEVRYPFDYGCVEMAESGNNLYLVTGHEGYVDAGVGQGHQGYLMVQIDKTTLKGSIVDCNLGHSFAQYIKSDGAQLYVLEQSEGGRCTELSKYDTASMKKQSLSVLEYGGFRTDAWAIACYASVDDLAVSSSNVLSVGTSIDQSQYDNVTSDMPHNLYLTITPKNNFTEDATMVKWLTDFTGDGASFLGVKLTKINDSRFMLSWEETGKTQKITDNDPLSVSILHYVFLDGNSEIVSQQFTAPAPISDCHPIVNGSKIVYSASSANTVAFYSIDANSGAFQKKVYRIAGENAVWNLSNGVLTISGTGAIDIDKEVHYRYPVSSTARSYSYSSADNSWKDIRECVTKIVIEKGITSIPEEAFYYFSNLKEAEIKEGLKSIGKKAFYACKNLRKITIPASVTEIGEECLATGYYWVGSKEPVVDAKIYAPKGSYAIKYAKQNNIAYTETKAAASGNNSGNTSANITRKKVRVTALTSSKAGTIKLKWKKLSGADGYEIQYARNAKFTKNKKKVTVKKAAATSKTIKKLKKKSRYYVRIRAYKKANRKTAYSKWSAKKSVKCK